MSTDRMLAWVGVVIGLLGLIPIFESANLQLRIAYSIILFLLLAGFIFLYRYGRGPIYETIRLRKVVTITQKDGSLAELRREQTIRVRYGSLDGIWWRGNSADGSLSEFKVDGNDPDKIETSAGEQSFYKAFQPPLPKGEEQQVNWSLQVIDSFKLAQESFEHNTIPWTKELEMEINFPHDRKCRNPRFYVKIAGDYVGPHDGMENIGDGLQLVAKVHAPKPGHTYCIGWAW